MKRNHTIEVTDIVKRLFGWNRSGMLVRATISVRHHPRRRSSC